VQRSSEPWGPSASLDTLRARAAALARIRAFFAARGVLEVDTPQLCPVSATDPLLDSVTAQPFRDGRDWYLQTSPEFPLKRLLAAGSGPLYQMGKCFRRGEAGPRHNPEFTMLEWYRPGFDLDTLIQEVASLVAELLPGLPLRRATYRELFRRYAGIDPFNDTDASVQARALVLAPDAAHWERDALLDLLFSAQVEPHLGAGWLGRAGTRPVIWSRRASSSSCGVSRSRTAMTNCATRPNCGVVSKPTTASACAAGSRPCRSTSACSRP
jgi:lysyl-tRNA synthetase class 2